MLSPGQRKKIDTKESFPCLLLLLIITVDCKAQTWRPVEFYTDFAARYADDARLAFVEVGFGHWSEYHIYGTKLELGKNFPSKEYQKRFFEHLNNVMADIPWAISIDAWDEDKTPLTDNENLMAIPFGLFDDSFMHKTHEIGTSDGYNEKCWNAIGRNTRWKTGFCGGEISYYSSNDQKNFLNPDGLYGHTWAEQAAKYHITFMIANDAPHGGVASLGRPSNLKKAEKNKKPPRLRLFEGLGLSFT